MRIVVELGVEETFFLKEQSSQDVVEEEEEEEGSRRKELTKKVVMFLTVSLRFGLALFVQRPLTSNPIGQQKKKATKGLLPCTESGIWSGTCSCHHHVMCQKNMMTGGLRLNLPAMPISKINIKDDKCKATLAPACARLVKIVEISVISCLGRQALQTMPVSFPRQLSKEKASEFSPIPNNRTGGGGEQKGAEKGC